MATHSRIPAWEILWTEEPGGLQSMRSQRVRHDWVTNTHRSFICDSAGLTGIYWTWMQAVCVFMSTPYIFLFWHYWPHSILLMANDRCTRSQVKIIPTHLEDLLTSCIVTLHLPDKSPGQVHYKLGKNICSAYPSGKGYKVMCQKVC